MSANSSIYLPRGGQTIERLRISKFLHGKYSSEFNSCAVLFMQQFWLRKNMNFPEEFPLILIKEGADRAP
jgi:hypothetical protein